MKNRVTLIGRLGADPELRETPNGMTVATATLATSMKSKGEEKTEWHRLIFFDRLAEIVCEYLKKGSLIDVEGRIQYRQYEKDGQKHYITEIIVNEMKMLSGRDDRDAGSARPAARPAAATSNDDFNDDDEDFNDDIAF